MPVEPLKTVDIVLNGETRTIPEDWTVAEMLKSLEIEPARIAIELNRDILKKENWTSTRLSGGEQLEIVQFVGGG